jgi:hypothetical protein
MIEHRLNHPVALAHVTTAILALGLGTVVLIRRQFARDAADERPFRHPQSPTIPVEFRIHPFPQLYE